RAEASRRKAGGQGDRGPRQTGELRCSLSAGRVRVAASTADEFGYKLARAAPPSLRSSGRRARPAPFTHPCGCGGSRVSKPVGDLGRGPAGRSGLRRGGLAARPRLPAGRGRAPAWAPALLFGNQAVAHRVLGDRVRVVELEQVVRTAGLVSNPRMAIAAKRLASDHGTCYVSVHVDVAGRSAGTEMIHYRRGAAEDAAGERV